MAKASTPKVKSKSKPGTKAPAGAKSPAKKSAATPAAAKPSSKPSGKAPTKGAGKPTSKDGKKQTPMVKAPASSSKDAKSAPSGKTTAPQAVKPGAASSAKPAAAPVAAVAPAPAVAAAVAGGAAIDPNKKPSPKGITIVNPKTMKKPKPKVKLVMPVTEPLIKPGTKWKPLIQSGPKAPPSTGDPYAPQMLEARGDKPAQKMNKRELDHYRQLLLKKRAELLGDITTIEDEALRQNSGSLSNLPQHMADQGSDTADQALSLDLAAVDRTILREIDEAMKRIDLGTFGICELTGNRIGTERLEEIPWTRYTIEAAREMERRPRSGMSSASAAESSEKDSSVD